MLSRAARALPVLILATSAACAPRVAARAPSAPEVLAPDVCAAAPKYAEPSTFFASADVEDATSLDVPSNGDLWASCAIGDTLYTAWGDGFGFAPPGSAPRPDIGVARVRGLPTDPSGLHGENVATDTAKTQSIFKVWTPGLYYQKPTGMLCRGGKIFMAVQDLDPATYDQAPAATIAESSDGGVTWVEGAAPMFANAVFTTVMFLDGAPPAAHGGDEYVYAYGLDFNFRGSPKVPTSQALYLARIPKSRSPRDRSAWEFYAGQAGDAAWTRDVFAKKPVLIDCTRRHARPGFVGEAVIAQGGVVYDAPLARYIYTSWSEYTYEFYEAPTPWGPWRRFLSKDFGPPPWTAKHHGGYGTTTPSLYISADGKTLWLQSNTWSAGVDHNNLALRKLTLEPSAPVATSAP